MATDSMESTLYLFTPLATAKDIRTTSIKI